MQEWRAYYGTRNPRTPNVLREVRQKGFALIAGSLSDVPAAMWDTEYGHWLRRVDWSHSVIAAVLSGPETFASLNLIRPQSAGPFGQEPVELVRMLIPHLRRAFQIQGRLETLHAYSEACKWRWIGSMRPVWRLTRGAA